MNIYGGYIPKGESVSLGVLDFESFKKVKQALDIELQQFLGWAGKVIPVDEVLERKYKRTVELMEERKLFLFPVLLNTNHETIGTVSLSILREGVGGIGMHLLKGYWGKGYGREVTKLICFYAFIVLNLRKVRLEVYSFNKRAIRCYTSVGFEEVGRLKEEIYCMGRYRDVIVMELFKERFLQLHREFVEKVKRINRIVD